jgi:phosphonoacetate hydrolase
VNSRSYALPREPLVVVCVDGCEPDYIAQAVASGDTPWLAQVLATGTGLIAEGVVPSFTNPNNLSIVTGVPPSVHGISGNYLLDPETGKEQMMNDPRWLRAPSLLAALANQGLKVAVVTAKDKLRALLGAGLHGICFSAENADRCTLAEHGIDDVLARVDRPLATVYSAELSEFVLASGVWLMQQERPDVLYLSTTDYVQHKYAPGTPQANAFLAMIDSHLARLEALGCMVVLTADHGMNPKVGMDGRPQILYLQTWFDKRLGQGEARVILPITDPYVVHHGALGSFATVYLRNPNEASKLCAALRDEVGVEAAKVRADAAQGFELPPDRIGDLVVVSKRFHVLGTSPGRHDLHGLDRPLRSHGGISEQQVPLLINRATPGVNASRRWRNFDAFDLALNWALPRATACAVTEACGADRPLAA